jgi:GntR family transcriptional regulator, vanillate catabolism transcriptional regulator
MKTRSQIATEIVRNWILDGAVKPGEHLEEIPLAAKLGISRTPLRLALSTLLNEGLVTYQPKRGFIVKGFDIGDIAAAYDVRAELEGMACRLVARNGLSADSERELRMYLVQGDEILAKGVLHPADHEPYRRINVALHETLTKLAANPWLERFIRDSHNIPFASDRIILWHDHSIIRRSHDDHHRIIDAVSARQERRAEEVMREHIYYAGLFLRRNFDRLFQTPQ